MSSHSAKQRSHKAHAKRSTRPKRNADSLSHLPPISVVIDHLGEKGNGVACSHADPKTRIYVPHSLPGETAIVQPKRKLATGIEAEIISISAPSSARKVADCQAAPACGGCQFQHAELEFYHDWKEQRIKNKVEQAGIVPRQWLPPFRAEPFSRRRARFAFLRLANSTAFGFRARASHQIIALNGCMILSKPILSACDDIRAMLDQSLMVGKAGEVEVNQCDNGLDVVIIMKTELSLDSIRQLVEYAVSTDIIRLSYDDGKSEPELLYQRQLPALAWVMPSGARRDAIMFYPPAGAFLQSVSAAEHIMRTDCYSALFAANCIIDLFSGSGCLGLALAMRPQPPKKLAAYDISQSAITAFHDIARNITSDVSSRLMAEQRNLHDDPMTEAELSEYDAAILDPPRSGAKQQMQALVDGGVTKIVMVSCHINSFIRDAAVLIEAGYICHWARHIDQFYLTSHSECIAYFERQ